MVHVRTSPICEPAEQCHVDGQSSMGEGNTHCLPLLGVEGMDAEVTSQVCTFRLETITTVGWRFWTILDSAVRGIGRSFYRTRYHSAFTAHHPQ